MSTQWERLKEERVRLGLSQEAFGRLGGVGKRSQINYESGERKPDSAYFEGIAAAGANIDYILTGVSATTRVRLNAQDETTKTAVALGLPDREGAFVRDVLYGVAMRDTLMIKEAIEHYVVERRTEPPRKEDAK